MQMGREYRVDEHDSNLPGNERFWKARLGRDLTAALLHDLGELVLTANQDGQRDHVGPLLGFRSGSLLFLAAALALALVLFLCHIDFSFLLMS